MDYISEINLKNSNCQLLQKMDIIFSNLTKKLNDSEWLDINNFIKCNYLNL